MTAALATLPDLLGTSPADLLVGVDRHDSTPDEARQRAERLRAGIVRYAEMRQDIADAFACRDWLVLGYDNWPAYVSGEFGDQLAQLARGERREAIADLRSQGMSTRQIADVTGIAQTQVVRDLKQVNTDGSPATVTGSDGKQHPATRPERVQTPGPTDAALSPPADPGTTPAPAVESPTAPVAPQEPDPNLAQRVWDVLDQHGNRPYGLTVGEIWLKLDGVHSAAIPAALAELAGAGRAVVMSHAQGTEPQELRARWLTRLISRTPEPVAVSAAHPGPGEGEAAAPVREGPGAAAEPTAKDRVAAALEQFVPDPGAPARAWGKELYVRVKPVHDFLLWIKADAVREFADEHDVETLRQLALSFTDLHRRVVEARTATVTPLRRIK